MERAPGMMRKLPICRLFVILMRILLDIEDQAVRHLAENEDEDAGESCGRVDQECLDRLAITLGGNTVVPVGSEQLPAYIGSSGRWISPLLLHQIAEGAQSFHYGLWPFRRPLQMMNKKLEHVVNMNSFEDPHPSVGWAAINAIGTSLVRDLQVQYHGCVLPALASAMMTSIFSSSG
ncbi:importin-5 [Artemisia annua]|uniref:Importin-5 n=1 Tax=Artemisia annua TaxID=35608 RepID=A0A2U1NAX3_ARTAN|nr:importin-5 [Artemisia annua]